MEMTCGFKAMLCLPVMILQEAGWIMKMEWQKLQFDADKSDKFAI